MLARPCSTRGASVGSEHAAAKPAKASLYCHACNRAWSSGPTARLHSPSSGGPAARRPRQRAVCASAPAQTGSASASTAQPDIVEVTVEKAGPNSRRVYAAIDIGAPVAVVWDALTDYDGLGNFIPGLAENRCLERSDGRAKLLQVGEQDVAMGFKFKARVVLDIGEHMHGVRPQLLSDEKVTNGCFPQPRLQGMPASALRDITFTLVEGDFQMFKGVWRMQQRQVSGGEAPGAARLAYALYVRPQAWLPVRLIQSRIESEVAANLRAVQQYAERMHQARQQVLPVVTELVQPWLAPDPAPLTDTQPPETLGDPDSRFIPVDGVLLHVKERGVRGAPAVLLLHGFNGSTFNWRGTMQPLSEVSVSDDYPGCHVIAFDRPPFGLSQRPLHWEEGRDPYSSEGGARLAAGLLDALGVRSAVIIGHSMGATVSVELLKQRPDLVAGLAWVAPALPAKPDQWRRSLNVGQQLQQALRLALINNDKAGLHYVRKQLRKRAEEVRSGKLKVHAQYPGESVEAVKEGYLRPMRATDWDRGSLLCFRSFSIPDVPPFETIRQPVVIIQGSEDPATKASSARQIAARLQSRRDAYTEYVELDGIGHVPMDEDPERYMSALVRFVQRVLQQGSGGNGARAAAGQGQPAGRSEAGSGDPLPAAAADDVITADGIASRV